MMSAVVTRTGTCARWRMKTATRRPRSATRVELPIARVAQSRHDVALFVQLVINRGQVDRHVRMGILQ